MSWHVVDFAVPFLFGLSAYRFIYGVYFEYTSIIHFAVVVVWLVTVDVLVPFEIKG